jgi:hypothetical protein
MPGTGRLLFIEVKGKALGKPTVTISRNQIVTAQNVGDDFILAVVQIRDGQAQEPIYIRGAHLHQSFSRSVDFSITSVNFKLAELLARGGPPL